MKIILSILLFAAISIQGTSYFWISIAFESQREYIENNLCINRFEAIPVCKGSCILEETMKNHEKNQESFPDLKLKEISLFYDFSNITIPSLLALNTTAKKHNTLPEKDKLPAFLQKIIKPPAASV